MLELLNRQDLNFLLFDVLDSEQLCRHERYELHNRATFEQAMDTAQTVAERYFAPHNTQADAQEPWFDGQQVHTLPEVKVACQHFRESGLLAARLDFDNQGMQLPASIAAACLAYVTAANPSTAAYPFLTMAAANLIGHFASPELQERYLPLLRDGRAMGTMALTEPDVGSSLADLKTSATPTEHGYYLIRGQKMYISGGDQDISDNIVHLVLARIKGAPAGVKGISLFLVPKQRIAADGKPTARNDVTLAGLLHKMGYRGTTSTVLNFGDDNDCQGFLIGEPHQGLNYMFMMMNEARTGVGLGAAVISYRGYLAALDYARNRPQGRQPSNRDANSPPVPIVQHGDVKRMLLAQKVYCEGALALCLMANRLIDDLELATEPDDRQRSQALLDLLTPIVKSWPSEYGVKANDLAIQVLGGSGYTRDYPLEQYYRDNRLNPIHEGTQGIQGLDLMGRKLWQHNSLGLQVLAERIQATLNAAEPLLILQAEARYLSETSQQVLQLIPELARQLQSRGPDATLANATVCLQYLGHWVVGWLWLQQAVFAALKLATCSDDERDFLRGKVQACRYFYRWEMPVMTLWHHLLQNGDDTCVNMEDGMF